MKGELDSGVPPESVHAYGTDWRTGMAAAHRRWRATHILDPSAPRRPNHFWRGEGWRNW